MLAREAGRRLVTNRISTPPSGVVPVDLTHRPLAACDSHDSLRPVGGFEPDHTVDVAGRVGFRADVPNGSPRDVKHEVYGDDPIDETNQAIVAAPDPQVRRTDAKVPTTLRERLVPNNS